ncbi:hypothetical protein [Imperialibacter sp.]|uniref:hypothetical protein n=1 Tax=Imperialibacter sp. TaxID=2038411 RepID=UPI0032EF3322
MRIHHGKGYRVYLKDVDGRIVLLINGGDKSSQQKDIIKARQLWEEYKKLF